MKKGDIAYYIANESILYGVIANVNVPDKQAKKDGGETLYDFGHGVSVTKVFKTEKAARKELDS